MDAVHQDPSMFINDLDFQSPSSSAQRGVSPNSPFDSFDFAQATSPNFPHTSSYNGSYQNSPFSGHSELSFGPGEGNDFSLFEDQPAGLEIREDYDPSEYDPPNPPGLLMFDGNFMSNADGQVSISLAGDHGSPHSFDYSSPSSNSGGDEGGRHSRASSTSSNHNHLAPTSPRLDVTRTFENLRVESPNWGTNPLPSERPLSPYPKPQSPPQLLIPDTSSPSSSTIYGQSPPIINAPDGDGSLVNGPQLHIVPATPISGGGSIAQSVPFRQTLGSMHQNPSQGAQQPANISWDQSEQSQLPDNATSLSGIGFGDRAQLSFTFPQQHSHDANASGLSTSDLGLNSQTSSDINFLYPIPPHRTRSKSDTSLPVPQWDVNFQDSLLNTDTSAVDDTVTVNMNDVLPPSGTMSHPSSVGPQQSSFNTPLQPLGFAANFSYGSSGTASAYLNVDYLPGGGLSELRRSKSESGPRPGHTRQSRSEDMRHSNALLYPPSSQQDFINHQFLHPQESLPLRGAGGHTRRASSGTRGDRLGVTGGSWSNSSSTRPSPYPSPSASPRFRTDELPNVSLPGRHAPVLQTEIDPDMVVPSNQPQSSVPILVSKPNVTTDRTADASHRRRKQDANFVCPVPGCGSTFTRSFNLKGHLRSHNEEKPFQCKWPGCGKGFARQHDCKRHEQLHSNYRPFTCEGCQKTFARMDALNRHLRSEGGADCQRQLSEGSHANGLSQPAHPPSITKTENEGGWPGMSVMV